MNTKVPKWLSVGFLSAGFLTYIVYLFCRKPAGMAGTEYEHIGWFIVDVFMIGGALLGLLLPERFNKLGGFCIVGLSFANLVLSAVEDTGGIFLVNDSKVTNKLDVWLDFFIGLVSMIAIACLVISLALPKTAKILGPVAAICFVASALLILVQGICMFFDSSHSWAYGINLIAVSLIIIGLAFGLVRYAFLLKPDFGKNKPVSKAPQTTEQKDSEAI